MVGETELNTTNTGDQAKVGLYLYLKNNECTESCIVYNTYADFDDETLRLPFTEQDAMLVQKDMLNQDAKLFKDASATDLERILKNAIEVASARCVPCIFYLSMHGMGGSKEAEALVGNDGSLLNEATLQTLLVSSLHVPYIVFIVDACNAGGLLNMEHTIAYNEHGGWYNTKQMGDNRAVASSWSSSPLNQPNAVPCLLITSAAEDQHAEAINNEGSIFI